MANKRGTITVLGGTDEAVKNGVVGNPIVPEYTMGQIAELALLGDASLACIVIDPQTRKVLVATAASGLARMAGIENSGGVGSIVKFLATGETKSKEYLEEGAVVMDGSVQGAEFPDISDRVSKPQRPTMTLSAFIGKVEDVNVIGANQQACLMYVSQSEEAIYVINFGTAAQAAAGYDAAKATAPVLAEFVASIPVAGPGSTRQFFE